MLVKAEHPKQKLEQYGFLKGHQIRSTLSNILACQPNKKGLQRNKLTSIPSGLRASVTSARLYSNIIRIHCCKFRVKMPIAVHVKHNKVSTNHEMCEVANLFHTATEMIMPQSCHFKKSNFTPCQKEL